MYVGDSSNSPVEQMSVKKYSQTSNPNLLDNTNFFNPINQRNQTSYSNTDAAPMSSYNDRVAALEEAMLVMLSRGVSNV